MWVCARGDTGDGLDEPGCESMLHVVGQASYVKGIVQGVVRVDPVYWRERLQRRTRVKPRFSKTKNVRMKHGMCRKTG